jgi:predicted nuclease of predicted toxin-antitoxin system
MSVTRLRFLADESCDFAVVRALRAEGHDVVAVAEYATRSIDRELMEQARQEERILITEDKDFGRLVFAGKMPSAGVILIRFPGNARSRLAQVVVHLVRERGAEIGGAFVVIQPAHIRISHQPNRK